MIGLFRRTLRAAPVDTSALGERALAMMVASGSAQPGGCTALVIDPQGRTRRLAAGARVVAGPGETAWLFRPGPYRMQLRPFAAAPEIGLRLCFVIDAPDPHAHQQRFDLYLASEVQGRVTVLTAADFFVAIETAVQRELAQGNLALPPCVTLAEWNLFRAGLNRLLYLRLGVTVDECLPVDLAGQVDYAAQLRARAASTQALPAQLASAPAPTPAPPATAPAPALADAQALRRLFLELPCQMCALRVAVLPRGQQLFAHHQSLLRRLDLASLQVGTMPALALAAPGAVLDPSRQGRRAAHARRACEALDELWALLARLQGEAGEAADLAALFDDAGRIVANLEADLDGRRDVDGGADVHVMAAP
ncbi:hypothetical protein [Massilia sp. DWR3-1-1]|uniref:hypothetical protein n=1 Tax=Massilia sp. DWR3-1-1 TaxID=2804559 RepID=UPI003CEB6C05